MKLGDASGGYKSILKEFPIKGKIRVAPRNSHEIRPYELSLICRAFFMKIIEPYVGEAEVIFEYEDCDSFDYLPYELCRQTYAVCYLENLKNIVIVHSGKKDTWGLIGGTIEKSESFEETLRREIHEEGNLELLEWKPVGVQKVINIKDGSFIYQLRFVAKARQYGPFEKDVGSVDKIAIIDPKEYKKYFDWGKIGERIFERAETLIKEM
jgi:ADP-ribose pyrophosphatase YjhB (NUDIX family)